MHVAITIGTLLLGGWVLDAPTNDQSTTVQPPQQSQANSPMLPSGQSGQSGLTSPSGRGAMGTTPQDDERAHGRPMTHGDRAGSQMLGGQTSGGNPLSGNQSSGARAAGRSGQSMLGVPASPTEALSPADQSMFGQPAPPTSNLPLTGSSPSGMSPGGMGYGSRPAPMIPTERRSSYSDSAFRPMSHSLSDQGRGPQMINNAVNMPAPTVMTPSAPSPSPPAIEKAFAGYKAPSGVSPYMNLFRSDSLGTVDNYTSLVRPQVEQRFSNQQFGQDIRGLSRDARTQSSNLQQLNQQSRALQGVGTPQFYMNTGTYFPNNGNTGTYSPYNGQGQ